MGQTTGYARDMENRTYNDQGIKLMVKRCRHEFQRPENTDYYDDTDYLSAERKFVKFCLLNELGGSLG
jgi:hypothetical protein